MLGERCHRGEVEDVEPEGVATLEVCRPELEVEVYFFGRHVFVDDDAEVLDFDFVPCGGVDESELDVAVRAFAGAVVAEVDFDGDAAEGLFADEEVATVVVEEFLEVAVVVDFVVCVSTELDFVDGYG